MNSYRTSYPNIPNFFDMAAQDYARTKHQRRMCEYLGLKCTHFRSIFCLPEAIRFQIYYEAGLIRDCDINLNRRSNNDDNFWLPTADCAFSHSLLLTCRAIYSEASAALYSRNRVFIRYRDCHGLQPLRNLTTQSLSYLTHLTVHLIVNSCEIGQACCNVYPGKPKTCDHHDKPLRLSPSSRHSLLLEWQSTIDGLKARLKPNRLHFKFICDVTDIESAKQITLPLLSVPTLASCSIRLGRKPDPLIKQLARTTAMQAVAQPSDPPVPSFRFLDLPSELRRQILEFTDLVTPLGEIEWDSRQGYRLRYSTWRCGGIGDCESFLHHACQFRNCWEDSNGGCFCSHSHAAFAPECGCWSPPTSLFFVCRTLLADARAVFFLRNRFIIRPACYLDEQASSRIPVSIFLTEILPSNALCLLRDLELVFPIAAHQYLHPYEPAYQDWIRTIDLVKEQLCLPLLTVRLYMAGRFPDETIALLHDLEIFSGPGMAICRTISRVVQPLSKLKGLHAFFVYLAWPSARSGAGQAESLDDTTRPSEHSIRRHEQDMEQTVMGSDYNSMTLQKDQQRQSQWMELALNATSQG